MSGKYVNFKESPTDIPTGMELTEVDDLISHNEQQWQPVHMVSHEIFAGI